MVTHSMESKLFFNFWEVVETTSFFLYIAIGGRGIGKTYSILDGLCNKQKSQFLYIRRTEEELKTSTTEGENPFKAINRDFNREIELVAEGKGYTIIEGETRLGKCGALSTFGKFRGADFNDIDYIFFDEFISTSPIDHLKKHEANLFFNLIETVQRNREILGKKSIKIILCANSNRLDSGIIKALELGEVIRQMKVKKVETWTDEERGVFLTLPRDLKITEMKKETSLYKLTKGTKFYDMSISNDFVADTFDDVKKIQANRLIPIVAFNNIYFYEIKGMNMLYATKRKTKCQSYNDDTKKAFLREYWFYLKIFIDGKKIYYSDYNVKLEVLDIA